jgi:hypothetical protein
MRISVRLGLVLTAFALVANEATAAIIGTFDSTRAGDANIVNGGLASEVRAALNANFPAESIVGTGTLTDAFLSGVDTLFLQSAFNAVTPISPLSSTEQQALLDFVAQGKSAFILAGGFFPVAAQSLVTPFNMQVTGYVSGTDAGTITNSTHLITNGPFGLVSTYTTAYPGWFTNLGPYSLSLASLGFNNQPSYAAIERNAIVPGSGRVILASNNGLFADANTLGGGYFAANQTLFLNSVQWLVAVPEPSSLVLAGVGAIAVAAWGLRRCRHALPASSAGEGIRTRSDVLLD